MHIGVPKEIQDRPYCERRVGLTPLGVREIILRGFKVWVEHDAGKGVGFEDEEYIQAGAEIVYGHDEIFQRSDLVVKVLRPHKDEFNILKEGQTILAFFNLAIASPDRVKILLDRKITSIGYEVMRNSSGEISVLKSMSRIAGAMAYQIAAHLLEVGSHEGRGVLIPGSVGIPPAEVVIVGAGNLGATAAEAFARAGASVYVIDADLRKLENIHRYHSRVVTMVYSRQTIERVIRFADVLITAILVPGSRTPLVITEDMVKKMRPGAVIIDFSIDQGGAVETSRPIPGYDSVYRVHNVIHFSVPNVPAFVPRTSSAALTSELLPFFFRMAGRSLVDCLREIPELRSGVYTYNGHLVQPPGNSETLGALLEEIP